jgi:hypothetical protein
MLWFPILLLLLAGLILWAFGRWLRIQQNNQRILENPVDRWQRPVVQVIEAQADNLVPYIERDVLDDGGYHPAPPDNQMRRWLDEVKRKLRSSDKQDEDDNTDN